MVASALVGIWGQNIIHFDTVFSEFEETREKVPLLVLQHCSFERGKKIKKENSPK